MIEALNYLYTPILSKITIARQLLLPRNDSDLLVVRHPGASVRATPVFFN